MSGSLARRVAAVEAKSADRPLRHFRFEPSRLNDAEMTAWEAAETAAAQKAGASLTIYSWLKAECAA